MTAGRGRVAAVRDPAIAVAAAKCWMARWGVAGRVAGIPLDSFHPEDCGFCDYPAEKLVAAVQEFGIWAGLDRLGVPGDILPLRAEIEAFEMLPREEQQRLVRKAQGYTVDDDDGEQ